MRGLILATLWLATTLYGEEPTSADPTLPVGDVEIAIETFTLPKLRWAEIEPPKYPRRQAAKGQEGWVRMNFMVDPKGKPYEIEVTDSVRQRLGLRPGQGSADSSHAAVGRRARQQGRRQRRTPHHLQRDRPGAFSRHAGCATRERGRAGRGVRGDGRWAGWRARRHRRSMYLPGEPGGILRDRCSAPSGRWLSGRPLREHVAEDLLLVIFGPNGH